MSTSSTRNATRNARGKSTTRWTARDTWMLIAVTLFTIGLGLMGKGMLDHGVELAFDPKPLWSGIALMVTGFFIWYRLRFHKKRR